MLYYCSNSHPVQFNTKQQEKSKSDLIWYWCELITPSAKDQYLIISLHMLHCSEQSQTNKFYKISSGQTSSETSSQENLCSLVDRNCNGKGTLKCTTLVSKQSSFINLDKRKQWSMHSKKVNGHFHEDFKTQIFLECFLGYKISQVIAVGVLKTVD